MLELSATADLEGAVALDASESFEPGQRPPPAFVVARRRLLRPETPAEGLTLFDLGALLDPSTLAPGDPWAHAAPWQRVVYARYLVDHPRAEGGLLRLELAYAFREGANQTPVMVSFDASVPNPPPPYQQWPTTPVRLVGRFAPEVITASGQPPSFVVDGIVKIEIVRGFLGAHKHFVTKIFVDGPGGPRLFGTVDATAPAATDDAFVRWTPAEGEPAEIAYTHVEGPEWSCTQWELGPAAFHARFVSYYLETAGFPLDDRFPAEVLVEDLVDELSAEWRRAVRVTDRRPSCAPGGPTPFAPPCPDPATPLYYAAFGAAGVAHTTAVATARLGNVAKLYASLPAVHRALDAVGPPDAPDQAWQLRRFLEVFGAALDRTQTNAEALRDRHDPATIDLRALPLLAGMLGLPFEPQAPPAVQRHDVATAPDLFGTVGTIPALRALVSRLGVKLVSVTEFAQHTCFTNAPEQIVAWELWSADAVGDKLGAPERRTTARGNLDLPERHCVDRRPSAAVDPSGQLWLFFSSNRTEGQRRAWHDLWGVKVGASIEPAPLLTPTAPGVNRDDPTVLPEQGGFRLFWAQTSGESTQIMTCHLTASAGPSGISFTATPALAVTPERAVARYPFALRTPAGSLLLLYEAPRRSASGDEDTLLWAAESADGSLWTAPRLISEARGRNGRASAALAPEGTVHAVWRIERPGQDELMTRTLAGGAWSPIAAITLTPEPGKSIPQRITSTTLVFMGDDRLLALGARDRLGLDCLYIVNPNGKADFLDVGKGGNTDPFLVTRADGNLTLFWRSQQGIQRFRSGTFDTNDSVQTAQTGPLSSARHVTYECSDPPPGLPGTTAPPSRRLRSGDTVALSLGAVGDGAPPSRPDVLRVRAFLEPFRPAHVRLAFFVGDELIAASPDT